MKKSESVMKRKGLFLFIVFIFCFIILIAHLTSIVFVEGKNYNLAVLQNASRREGSVELNDKRGVITDRNGIVLADSVSTYDLIFDAKLLSEQEDKIQLESINYLHEQLGFSVEELKQILIDKRNSNYVIIGKGYSYSEIKDVKAAIDQYHLIGVFYREEYERYYPYPTLASSIIGFTNEEFHGVTGIEEYYDDFLTGQTGRMYGAINEENQLEVNEVKAQDGDNIMLSLDYTVQKYIQEAIDHYFETDQAKRIQVIVMNPNNGEIYGMANYPDFNQNEPYDLSAFLSEEELSQMSVEDKSDYLAEIWKAESVASSYEPGSTFKPFVYAMDKEERRSKDDELFYCDGGLQVADRYIECWKHEGHGYQTMEEALENSCNVALMKMGAEVGRDLFYKYQHMFGFGSKTNVDITGDQSFRTLIHDYDKLQAVQLATSAFGQTFQITPLQLITGFSSLINGGYLYEPHFMKKIYQEDQVVESYSPKVVRQVISEEVSKMTTEALGGVVNEGTGSRASIAGYEIGGKTGTAEKRERDDIHYIVSFIGFAPIEDPQVITLVVVDEPAGSVINSRFAASIFVDVMEDVMPYLHIFKEVEDDVEDVPDDAIREIDTPQELEAQENNGQDNDNNQGEESGQEAQ